MELYKQCRGMSSWMVRSRLKEQIGGVGDIVEVDECQLGRRKHHRGRIPQEIWVVGGVVRGSNPLRCFVEIVSKHNKRTLEEVLQ